MKLFDVIKQSIRLVITHQGWVMDANALKFKVLLPVQHVQFTKSLMTEEGERHFQCFASDQDIEIGPDGSAEVSIFMLDTKTLLVQGKVVETNEKFKFTFYKEVPFSSGSQVEEDSKNYRWLIQKAANYHAFSFDAVGGCIEVWDESSSQELDQDITNMRKKETPDDQASDN